MSSPTINLVPLGSDTSLENIMNLTRALVNDSQQGATATPGEGQILTDNPTISPFTQPFLNSSIRELYRELRNVGQPTLVKDNYLILNVPTFTSPTYGSAVYDPAVQVYIDFGGYFDGVTINPLYTLPNDLIYPEKLCERGSGTNDVFAMMSQPEFGLPNSYQGPKMRFWEWRQDKIWMPGATTARDFKLRYWCSLPTFFGKNVDFSSTYVPIIDCTDAVAYKTATKYAYSLGAPGAAALEKQAAMQMFQLKNAHVRRSQAINYQRPVYHGYGNHYSTAGYIVGWQ